MIGLRNLILIPLLSLLPCVIWLWYFASQSVYKRPSRQSLFITFALGGLVTVPAVLINLLLQEAFIDFFGVHRSLMLLLIVGPVEEAMKLLAVYGYAFRSKEFDEPLDGVVYSAAAALGFAAIENIVYLAQTGPMLVLLRGPFTNPGHALFSSIWGLSLSRAKAAPNILQQRFVIVLKGWALASVIHGTFDILLLSARSSIVFLALLAASFVTLFIWVRSRIVYFQKNSPFRQSTVIMPAGTYCPHCGAYGISGARCSNCGNQLPEMVELFLCPVCDVEQRPGAKFCSRCGANLKLGASANLHERPHFVAVTKEGEEKIAFILNRQDVNVGRTLNNEFVIEHPSVSKHHAKLSSKHDEVALEDLGSANGTFVNGLRVSKALLEDGCEVRFGRAHFVYRAAQSAADAAGKDA